MQFLISRLVAGLLVVTPIYLAALLLLKAAKSMSSLVRPLAKLLPPSLREEHILSLVLVLFGCFLIGLAVRTRMGHAAWQRIEHSFFQRIPGYTVFQNLTQRLGGEIQDEKWKPALVEIEHALVPAFIIEELDDGRFTVFVPSVPTPVTGAVYILSADRVHPLDIPFTRAIKAVSQWGSGSKDLVAAMRQERNAVKLYDA